MVKGSQVHKELVEITAAGTLGVGGVALGKLGVDGRGGRGENASCERSSDERGAEGDHGV